MSRAYRAMVILSLMLANALVLAAPPPFRALQVYTRSAPEAANPGKIVARTTFVNRGAARMTVSARLQPCPTAGVAGGTLPNTRIEAGKSFEWVWTFTPPAGVQREILTGDIKLNGQPARDLYLAVQGADPADFNDPGGAEQITERARVVATYAPRSAASLAQRQMVGDPLARKVPRIGDKGKTDYTIATRVLPDPPAEGDAIAAWRANPALTAPQRELVDAIADLRRVVQLKTDAVLPISAAEGRRSIILRLADLGQAAAGLHDAYRLKSAHGNIIIEAANLDGLRNGVYGLLTDHLNSRWYAPRQLGEEIAIPENKVVPMPIVDEVKGSRWFSTGGATWGYDPLWDRRNRAVVNRGRMNFGHSWHGYVNKSEFPYEKYPDYYARDREGKILLFDSGWSSTNFCSTNPDVIEIVAKKVNAYFTANPDAPVASLDPNDYGPMCLCDRCLALDKQYGQTAEDGKEVADRLHHFSQQIYDRLEPRFQDRYLGILIYAYQMELPISLKPHPHHAGMICNFPPRYDFSRPWTDPTSAANRDFLRLVKGWGGMLSQFGYYEYPDHYWYFGPWGIIHKMREDLPAFRELGGTFLIMEADANFGMQGLNNYISAVLEWDVDADIDRAMDEYFRGYYGPASAPMRNFFLAAERHFNLERPGKHTEVRVAMRPEFWQELAGYLQEAERIAAGLPAKDKRFADRIRLNRDGFDYGRARFAYDLKFHRVGEKLGAVDHAAAIAFLRDHRAQIDGLQKKYPLEDPYWPALVPGYSQLNVDERIKQHEAALKERGE